MKRILTAAEMREADRLTIEQRGVPGLILMESAGARVVEFLAERFRPLAEQRIVILCGKGNNGGDGLVVARHLLVRSLARDLTVVLCADPAKLRGDAAANFRMLEAVEGVVHVAQDVEEWKAPRDRALSATLLVDALLGTGLSGAARGFYGDLIEDLNRNFRHCRVVAVDMPSGMGSDSGATPGPCLRVDATVTFTAPKVSQVFPPNCERVGELHTVSIGTADSLIRALPGKPLLLSEGADFRAFFRPRQSSAHKGSFGHVALVAGSRAKPGAARMAGLAALRIGAGLTTVVTAAGACAPIAAGAPELMTFPVEELPDGSIGDEAFDPDWFARATLVAVGPGLGTVDGNQRLVRRIVAETELPLVADADALTALAEADDELWQSRGAPLILTPHPGEMARLCGKTSAEVQQNRVATAREFAERRGVYLVLKGNRTLIASPDGQVIVNPTGTPAMATAGSGDILTGMIAGLLAQFPDSPVEMVAAAAVYLHGRAGEIGAERRGEASLLAGDLLETLPEAIAGLL